MSDSIAYEPRPISDPSWCCHGCGYQLEGLVPRQRCPECGTQCERLPGTAWQLFGDRKGYAEFVMLFLSAPLRAMRSVRPDPWGFRSQQLLWAHAVFTLVVITAWPTLLAAITPRSAEGLVRAWPGAVLACGAAMGASWWGSGAVVRAARLPALVRPLRAHAALGWAAGAVLAGAALLGGVVWFESHADRGIRTRWAIALPAAGMSIGAALSLGMAWLGTLRSRPSTRDAGLHAAERVELDRSRRERKARAFDRLSGVNVSDDESHA